MATKPASTNTTTFDWVGKDRQGKTRKGSQKGADVVAIKAGLRKQGIIPIKVSKQKESLFSGKKKKPIKPADIALFSRQLATMLTSGVPLVQGFEIVANGLDNLSMKELILAIKTDVEGGSTFAEALSRHPLQFDSLYVNLVNSGEQAGILDSLLDKVATNMEKTEEMKGKIKSAMFYPAAVMAVAAIVTCILLIFVIPMFDSLFKSFGGELPALTRMVVDLSEWVQAYWWIGLGGLFATGYAFAYFKKRSKKFGIWLDKMSLGIPIVGIIITKGTIARFARTLSTMSAAGVPLVEAMDSVAKAAGNIVYEKGIYDMREQVSMGSTLQSSMEGTGLFNNMEIQMIAIGEEAGSLDSMLEKVADYYESEVDNLVDSLTSMLEPMIMAFLGVVVGGLVIAMYLPIFKMGEVV